MTTPRGIRNNNPGNIEWGDPWQGLDPKGREQDGRFAVFTKPVWGIRALARTLITYYDKHGIRTVERAINRWAPPTENNTGSYVNQVAKTVGVPPGAIINFHDYEVLKPMVEAIIRHENGPGPLKTTNTWYEDELLDEALKLAGVVPSIPKPLLVTKEGAAAGAVVATGGAAVVADLATQLAPLATEVRLTAQQTEGLPGWLRAAAIVLSLVSVAAGVYILWKKHKERKAL